MTVPFTFGTATTSIPLSNLDSNFNTPITLGNTSIYLGNTTTTIGNLTLTNATISSGNVTISNITVTTANVTTANVATLSVTGTATIATANITTGNITTLTSTSITDSGLTSGRVTYAGASGLLSDSANLTFDGTNLTNGSITSSITVAKVFISGTGIGYLGVDSYTVNGIYLINNNTGTTTTGVPTATVGLMGTGAYPLVLGTNSTEIIRITNAGLVGIGTSSPRLSLDVSGSVLIGTYQTSTNYATLNIKPSGTITTPSTFTNAINIWNGTNVGEYSNITFGYNSIGLTNAPSYFGFVSTSTSGAGKGDLVFGTRDVTTDTAATERMRIDSSGNLEVGTTLANSGIKLFPSFSSSGSSGININHVSTAASGEYYVVFQYNASVIGYISQNGTTAVAYNTTSDYRLKQNIEPMTGALATVAQLKPVTYKWKTDGLDGQGFIAHELQAVVPDCVTGEKDAVDADGKPVYQGVDTSFLVATLTKAIQEQQALIESLTTRLTNLENK